MFSPIVKVHYCKPTLFATTLFRDLQEINWLAATTFHDQDVDCLENNIPETFEN